MALSEDPDFVQQKDCAMALSCAGGKTGIMGPAAQRHLKLEPAGRHGSHHAFGLVDLAASKHQAALLDQPATFSAFAEIEQAPDVIATFHTLKS